MLHIILYVAAAKGLKRNAPSVVADPRRFLALLGNVRP